MKKKENKKKQARKNKKVPNVQKPTTAATKKSATKHEIKVGDKIVGQVNGAVGIVKTIRTDANFGGVKPRTYAIIDIQNPKKGQCKSTVADITYLQQQEKRGGIKITTPRKTANKTATTAPSKVTKKSTAKQPAKKASNQKQQIKKQSTKKEEGEKPSHPQGKLHTLSDNKKSTPKKSKRKNVSQNVPNGTIIHSNDKYFEGADGLSDKGRYAIVVDSNRDDELAVVKATHSKKVPSHKLTVLDGKSNVLPGGLRTKDIAQNPITINERFEGKPEKGTVSKHEVNQIKTMLVTDKRFGKRNQEKLHELKKR